MGKGLEGDVLFINGERYIKDKEKKSERLQLLVRPDTIKKLKKIAYENDISLNELANQILEYFLTQFDMGWKP